MSEWRTRYYHDAYFKRLVDTLFHEIVEGRIEAQELYSAVFIATDMVHEHQRLHPDWKPKTKQQRDEDHRRAVEMAMMSTQNHILVDDNG